MLRVYDRQYSQCLNRHMSILRYGDRGQPIIVFPCQDAMSDNFENFNMIDNLSDYINNGQIQLFCVDTVDTESWSDVNGDKNHRAYMQEQYYYYIVDEFLPYIQQKYNIWERPMVMGCSLGATHAAICFFRRPDLFEGVISLSGAYDAKYFFDGWMNETLYNNSPVHFIENMPQDHSWISLYNQRKIIICVGQGRWEDEGIRTTKQLKDIFNRKGIQAWVDLWGYDVDHDWPWWKIQIRYFLDAILNK